MDCWLWLGSHSPIPPVAKYAAAQSSQVHIGIWNARYADNAAGALCSIYLDSEAAKFGNPFWSFS